MQKHPIPSVTEPLQYRAIGIVRGTYKPNNAQDFNRGILIDSSGVEIDAVVLGRVITLMRRHISIDKPHLWVVYPRSRDSNSLHLQISGIWEPSTLDKKYNESPNLEKIPQLHDDENDVVEEGDDYFSIRGELIFINPESKELIVKVRQKQRNKFNKNLPFKIILKGDIPSQFHRHFVSLDVRRIKQQLILEKFDIISAMPKKENKNRQKPKPLERNKS